MKLVSIHQTISQLLPPAIFYHEQITSWLKQQQIYLAMRQNIVQNEPKKLEPKM